MMLKKLCLMCAAFMLTIDLAAADQHWNCLANNVTGMQWRDGRLVNINDDELLIYLTHSTTNIPPACEDDLKNDHPQFFSDGTLMISKQCYQIISLGLGMTIVDACKVVSSKKDGVFHPYSVQCQSNTQVFNFNVPEAIGGVGAFHAAMLPKHIKPMTTKPSEPFLVAYGFCLPKQP